MERHARDAAYVDAGRGKDPPGANATGKSLVERALVRFSARTNDQFNALR